MEEEKDEDEDEEEEEEVHGRQMPSGSYHVKDITTIVVSQSR